MCMKCIWICQLNENTTVIHYFYFPPLPSHRKKKSNHVTYDKIDLQVAPKT